MKLKCARVSVLVLLPGTLLFAQGVQAQVSEAGSPATVEIGNTQWFPNFWRPYGSPYIPAPKMSNSERLHTLLSDNKLRLSIEDVLALALENNLDISIARYNLGFAQADLLRSSGGATRGVPGAFQSSALFSGAIGSGVSAVSSGSTTSASGVTGTGGATNVGVIGCCDPVTGAQFGWDRRTSPLNYVLVSGLPVVTTQTTNGVAYFGQGFLTEPAMPSPFRVIASLPHRSIRFSTPWCLPGSRWDSTSSYERVRPSRQRQVHSHRAKRPEDIKQHIPPAGYHHGRPGVESLLGLPILQRECCCCGTSAGLLAKTAF